MATAQPVEASSYSFSRPISRAGVTGVCPGAGSAVV